ncbi:hypothetical protein VTO73DRAFT_2732 [Trametes versicolor]
MRYPGSRDIPSSHDRKYRLFLYPPLDPDLLFRYPRLPARVRSLTHLRLRFPLDPIPAVSALSAFFDQCLSPLICRFISLRLVRTCIPRSRTGAIQLGRANPLTAAMEGGGCSIRLDRRRCRSRHRLGVRCNSV